MIFDTHAHYNDAQYDKDRDEVLRELPAQNVCGVINAGASLQDCLDSLELAHSYPYVYAALGVHPDEVGSLDDTRMQWLCMTAQSEEKVVAIGEIGLDYHWDVEPHDVQKHWFIEQMNMAKALDLPVVIHSREAAQDTFDILKEHSDGLRGSLHCYPYSAQMALHYIDMGFYIGVGGVLTFKNSRKLKETVSMVPLDRIVLETDCPYLAPTPHRGTRNHSGYIDLVAQCLADIRRISKEEVLEVTEANARRLFLGE